MQRRTSRTLSALVIGALLALGACGDDDEPATDDTDEAGEAGEADEAGEAEDADDTDSEAVELDDAATIVVRTSTVAFDVDVPASMGISSLVEGAGGDGACRGVRAQFDGDASLVIEAFGRRCAAGDTQIGNGNHGTYRSIEDVPEPLERKDIDTALGPAVLFEQAYFECTNECNDYVDTVAIVTLDEPVNRDYPSLVMRSDKGELDRETLTAIAASLADPAS